FAKLPSKTLTSLLKPENRQELRRVLLFHVVSGRVDASKARKLDSAKTLAGPRLALSPRGDSGLKVGRAKVVSADIGANNGIIHVIDRVLLPPDLDLVETASKAGKFRTLLAAAEAAGLVEELTGQGPLTLLAPTDSAFDKLPKGTVSTLLEPENRQTLRLVLSNHILHGRVYANEAIKAGTAKSAAHRKLRFGIDDGRLTVDGARVIRTDIDATNGVVHVIDRVLVPE
ncbi:MAG: fasciclin domain-containing protein, partial [Deltaproteobacteria bacterium]|nr:fasciclin domain-containing protein [Deltaproteobacteria bacterium]